MKSVIIYLGGRGPLRLPKIESKVVATIAADSGLALADNFGVDVDLVVGDMDSVDAELLSKYDSQGSHISIFPKEKDQTDFELAVLAAKNYAADQIVVIGGGGDRLDHLLANVAVLAGSQTEKFFVEAFLGESTIKICRPSQHVSWTGKIGSQVSLLPLGQSAKGVTTSGLKWDLENETLNYFEARGISNVVVKETIEIECLEGTLAVIT